VTDGGGGGGDDGGGGGGARGRRRGGGGAVEIVYNKKLFKIKKELSKTGNSRSGGRRGEPK
jgi:hypothetical protein